jgi:hypothetical protein
LATLRRHWAKCPILGLVETVHTSDIELFLPLCQVRPMAYTKTLGVSQSARDWGSWIRTVPGSSPAAAARLATADPAVTFFSYCREQLTTPAGTFAAGDALFFAGDPTLVETAQCDTYQRSFRNVAYFDTRADETTFKDVACYRLADGQPFFDIACVFAANINAAAPGVPQLWFNDSVTALLASGQIQELQAAGISVLLTVLNNHQDAGWSCITEQSVAQSFAAELAACVTKYGLDGIDIDDEYDACGAYNETSLAMVTYEMRQAMPGAIISKALFDDDQYFQASWEGHTLAQNLTYGWEMSYGQADYGQRLQPYVGYGMPLGTLGLGVSTDGSDGPDAASYVTKNGVGGLMVFGVTSGSAGYLDPVAQAMYGQGIVVPPGCMS